MICNTMDEDWDERRDGGKVVPEYELRDFTKILLRNGKEHTSYYHYTNWGAFEKMMEEVKGGPAKGLRMLLLSPANKTNDGIERCWGRNVHQESFSNRRWCLWRILLSRSFAVHQETRPVLRASENQSGLFAYQEG